MWMGVAPCRRLPASPCDSAHFHLPLAGAFRPLHSMRIISISPLAGVFPPLHVSHHSHLLSILKLETEKKLSRKMRGICSIFQSETLRTSLTPRSRPCFPCQARRTIKAPVNYVEFQRYRISAMLSCIFPHDYTGRKAYQRKPSCYERRGGTYEPLRHHSRHWIRHRSFDCFSARWASWTHFCSHNLLENFLKSWLQRSAQSSAAHSHCEPDYYHHVRLQ
jgi:hypothetical protein